VKQTTVYTILIV